MPQTTTGSSGSTGASGSQSSSQGGLPEYGSTAGSTASGSGQQQGDGLPESGDSAGNGGQQGGLPEYGNSGTGGNIAYGSADDPFGDIGSNSGVAGSGAAGSGEGGQGGNDGVSTQARIEALDERLEEGYEVFDGMILGERERAQSVETGNQAGGGSIEGGDPYGGLGLPGEGEGSGGEGGQVIARSEGANAGGGYMPDVPSRQGDFENSNQPQYPVPEDIPGGNDDDVVARQLREAAMSEPDPELREKLWDEYRAYKGIAKE